ncbi:hypothetical protein ACFY4C_19965 [Actinomadura viridis]|uniref:hypothetical protein n=1 Tax=Actinomadura viridis TaxID=58110 RepID=UPI0036A18360
MLAAGRSRQAIAEEMMRRWGYRARAAWRHAHGWSQDTAADHYNRRHDHDGRAPMSGSRVGAYERWPHGGERPRLTILRGLADVYGTDITRLVDEDDLARLPEAHRLTLLDLINARPPEVRTRDEDAYGREEPFAYEDPEHEVVIMAAHESSEHAERAERRDIGEAPLEQMRADVVRLANEYLTGDPFPLFQEMRRVRARMYSALDKKLWPRDATELYLLLGALHALMANAAQDLGYPHAAGELLRAGWAYAQGIGHRPLMGFMRGALSSIAYWEGRPRQARDLARSGFAYLPDGPGAAHLHLLDARACARLGDEEGVRAALEEGRAAAERPYTDEVHDEIGGEFACSAAYRASLAGTALLEIPGGDDDAVPVLERGAALYAEAPAEQRSYGTEAITRIHLARGQLRAGRLEAVDLSLVFALPADRRIDALPKALGGVRAELASPRYRGDPRAAELDERIEAFCRETIVHDLHELPNGG